MRRILMMVPILAALMIVLTPGQALADPAGIGVLKSLSHLGNAACPAIGGHFELLFPDGGVADAVDFVTPVAGPNAPAPSCQGKGP